MIKVIELFPNEYDFELKLKSLVNDGEFIGTVKVKSGFEDIIVLEGEHSWADFLEYGVAIINDEQDYKNYGYYVKGKRYSLGEIMRSEDKLNELIENICIGCYGSVRTKK